MVIKVCCIWLLIVSFSISDATSEARYSLPFSRPIPVNAKRYGNDADFPSPLLVSDRSGGLIPRSFVVLLSGDGVGIKEPPAGQTLVEERPSNFRDWLKIGWHY